MTDSALNYLDHTAEHNSVSIILTTVCIVDNDPADPERLHVKIPEVTTGSSEMTEITNRCGEGGSDWAIW